MSSIHVVCTPFEGTQDRQILGVLQKYAAKAAAGHPVFVIPQMSSPECLAECPSFATLIICAHTRSDSPWTLHETSDSSGRSILIQDFVNLLLHAKLPGDHVLIQIAGRESSVFARNLARALADSHPNIVVGGYTNVISFAQAHRTLIELPANLAEKVVDTGGVSAAQWFNAEGPTQKPESHVPESST